MKVLGIIPARYQSSRLPGKPLADIHGKPMIWWTYQQAKKSMKLSSVVCAIDDERIKEACEKYDIPFIMTRSDHQNHIARIQEVSCKYNAEYYICINGDEPMISSECIDRVIPDVFEDIPIYYGAVRKLSDAAETIDFSNIKVVLNHNHKCIYLSRTPVPYPRGTLEFNYWKYVGIECFTKKALDIFVSKVMTELEKIEDIDHLRFIENDIPMYFTEVISESISVDTKKDLEYVRNHIMI